MVEDAFCIHDEGCVITGILGCKKTPLKLLAGRPDSVPDIIDPLISAEITNNSRFLVVSYPIGTGEETSILEVSTLESSTLE